METSSLSRCCAEFKDMDLQTALNFFVTPNQQELKHLIVDENADEKTLFDIYNRLEKHEKKILALQAAVDALPLSDPDKVVAVEALKEIARECFQRKRLASSLSSGTRVRFLLLLTW